MRKTVNCESLTMAKEASAPHVTGPYVFDLDTESIRKLRPVKMQRKTAKGAWVYHIEQHPEGVPLASIIFGKRPEMQATARLFASAPDLLEALESAVEQLSQFARLVSDDDTDFRGALESAESAIAKARGQT